MDVPPERIELAAVGAVLRRHCLDDLDALHTAIEESRDHLRPFMPFADQSRLDTAGFIALAITQWTERASFNYLILDADDGAGAPYALGGCGLHRRIGAGATEIGYWLRASAAGRGIVTAAAAALTDAAFAIHGIERVEIHCDEANARSAAVARRLGFRLDRIETDQISAPGELGRSMIWVRSPDGGVSEMSGPSQAARDAGAR